MTGVVRAEENLGSGMVRSVLLHALIFGGSAAFGLWTLESRTQWGDPNANPGAGFAVTPVDRIPLPTRQAAPNPKAEDSEADVEKVDPAGRDRDRQEKQDADAIALKGRDRPEQKATSRYRYRSSEELRQNQLKSTTGQAASNPMYGMIGAGGVGVGTGTPFGNRFGAYAELLRRRISEKWRTSDVDPIGRTAKPATISFEILRNGTIRNVKVVESSGVPTLDYSARRAVTEASPLPELPREFDRDSAYVEFIFQLQR